jgi:Ca2+/Na+ antiporter
LLSDNIVAGFYFLPNGSITRIAGEYYFVFQAYILIFLLCSIFGLVKGAMIKKEYDVKSRCIIALWAFCPAIVLIFILMILMQLGYRVNMAGFLSLALCFMLFVFISLSEKHKLFTMMKFVPFSQERAYHLELRKHIEKLTLPATGEFIDMKSILKEVEMVVIRHTHQQADSQKEVARRLRLSESSLSKKMSKKS